MLRRNCTLLFPSLQVPGPGAELRGREDLAGEAHRLFFDAFSQSVAGGLPEGRVRPNPGRLLVCVPVRPSHHNFRRYCHFRGFRLYSHSTFLYRSCHPGSGSNFCERARLLRAKFIDGPRTIFIDLFLPGLCRPRDKLLRKKRTTYPFGAEPGRRGVELDHWGGGKWIAEALLWRIAGTRSA